MVGYRDAYLLGRDSKVRRTIQRRPDRNWLERPEGAAVAPDGSFAITTGRNFAKNPWQAHLYSASGDPITNVGHASRMQELLLLYLHGQTFSGRQRVWSLSPSEYWRTESEIRCRS